MFFIIFLLYSDNNAFLNYFFIDLGTETLAFSPFSAATSASSVAMRAAKLSSVISGATRR